MAWCRVAGAAGAEAAGQERFAALLRSQVRAGGAAHALPGPLVVDSDAEEAVWSTIDKLPVPMSVTQHFAPAAQKENRAQMIEIHTQRSFGAVWGGLRPAPATAVAP